MKKCNCTVIYRHTDNHYELINIIAKHKHENILLYSENWDETDRKHCYKYESLNEVYKSVLSFLKNNNLYVHKWKMFESTWMESTWYDIDFIDADRLTVCRYPYK